MRQRGVALITAIVVVAIATILAVRIGTRAAMDLRRTAGLVALDQGWHVALGAEAWAIEVLKDDIKNSREFDHPGEAWAQPLPPLPIDGGEVRGALEDVQGRFNLNNLVTAERETDTANVERFADLLIQVGAQPRWASLMADWIDESPQANSPEGAEDGTYLAQNPPYRAANGLIATTTEMMALPGMTRDEFERIRPYVTALPPGTRINVCTAKPPVLAVLSKGGLDFSNEELLAANRRDGCYPTPEMFDDQFETQQERDRVISKTTNWFRAVTAVRIGTSEFTLYSLINRDDNDTAIRTVLRSTGTE